MINILIAEDEKDIAELIKLYVENHETYCFVASNGQEAIDIIKNHPIHCVLLDLMMPKVDGLEVLNAIQDRRIATIVISAKSEKKDIINALNSGADDYLVKPFDANELVARINALLRRTNNPIAKEEKLITVKNFTLDPTMWSLKKGDETIFLTPTEYKMCAILMSSPGKIMTRSQLYEAIGGNFFESDTSTVQVHISNLRDKIETNPKQPTHIITIRGLGYKFENN